jgi:hypothetical protein
MANVSVITAISNAMETILADCWFEIFDAVKLFTFNAVVAGESDSVATYHYLLCISLTDY